MPTLRINCPFCAEPTRVELSACVGLRKPSAEEGKPLRQWLSEKYQGMERDDLFQNALQNNFYTFFAPALCPECKEYCLIKGIVTGSVEALGRGQDAGIDYSERVRILLVSPESSISYPPEVPPEIAEVMVELEEDLRRGRNEARILSGCRSVLDVALQKLGETSGGRGDRIGRLGAKGLLTAGLSDWAKRLWQDGHDGVHELQAKGHPVAEHVAFLKLFIEVAFVIPGKISAGKVAP